MFNSVVEAVFHHADRTPDRLCLADDQGRVTYREYADRISRLAGFFHKSSIVPGDRVVVEACQSIDYLAVELALQLLGAVFVPLEHNCASEKIAAILERVEAAALIACNVDGHILDKRWNYGDLRWKDEPCPITDWPASETVSEILFSTGTTGREKGIVLTHANDIALAENVIHGVEMERDNVEMIPSPMNHSHGLRRYYANMVNGSTVILLGSAMDMRRFMDNMDTYGVNALDLVPAALTVVLKLSRGRLADYRHQLRYVQFGAAPMRDEDRREICRLLPDTRLYNFYGSTESGCTAIYNFNRSDAKPGCIGRPTHNADIFIVDDDRRTIATSEMHTGLLACAGPMNMLGYWRDDTETASAMTDRVVYSNDEAYFDKDGDIILLGRRGDVINVSGNKVAPDEIENVARQFPGVADCAVISISDPYKGNVPKLFIQTSKDHQVNHAALYAYLSDHLEGYKLPAAIEIIDAIPRSFNGKVLRKELK